MFANRLGVVSSKLREYIHLRFIVLMLLTYVFFKIQYQRLEINVLVSLIPIGAIYYFALKRYQKTPWKAYVIILTVFVCIYKTICGDFYVPDYTNDITHPIKIVVTTVANSKRVEATLHWLKSTMLPFSIKYGYNPIPEDTVRSIVDKLNVSYLNAELYEEALRETGMDRNVKRVANVVNFRNIVLDFRNQRDYEWEVIVEDDAAPVHFDIKRRMHYIAETTKSDLVWLDNRNVLTSTTKIYGGLVGFMFRRQVVPKLAEVLRIDGPYFLKLKRPWVDELLSIVCAENLFSCQVYPLLKEKSGFSSFNKNEGWLTKLNMG